MVTSLLSFPEVIFRVVLRVVAAVLRVMVTVIWLGPTPVGFSMVHQLSVSAFSKMTVHSPLLLTGMDSVLPSTGTVICVWLTTKKSFSGLSLQETKLAAKNSKSAVSFRVGFMVVVFIFCKDMEKLGVMGFGL